MNYRRPLLGALIGRLREPRRFMQVLAGPRQVGKTTLVQQAMEEIDLPTHYASADDPVGRDPAWLREQWDLGRLAVRDGGRRGALLVLDEGPEDPGLGQPDEAPLG